MSNPAKPFVLQHAVPSGVVATRWWWVRHAPVRDDGGNIYGQKDMPCDCSDSVVFDAVGKILPRDAVWVASKLQRTHQTAAAIWAAGFPKPDAMPYEADLNEQHLGDWQGLNRAEFFATRPINVGSYWFAPIDEPSPNGESFMDLYNRVRRAIERINAEHAGKDIIAVAHGGTIKAAIGAGTRRPAGKGPRLHHRQLLDHAARSSGERPATAAGAFPSSTSSHGSRMPRTPRCISRPVRKWCR